MTTTEIIKALADRLDLTQKESRQILQKTLSNFREVLMEGKSFTIRDFGTFGTRKRPERRSYNPFIKKYLKLPPRVVAYFKPGSKLKNRAKEREQQ